MAGRPVRIAFLALAAWAVLFAPGSAAATAGTGGGTVDAEDVAAAVVAPTFGSDGVVMSRVARDDDRVEAPDAPGSADLRCAGDGGLIDVSTTLENERSRARTPDGWHDAGPRGPPKD